MMEDIIYTVDVNRDGSLKCGVMVPVGEDGDLPPSISESIRRVLGLGPDEDPVFETDEKGRIIIKKKVK